MKKLTHKSYIKRVSILHRNIYDYSDTKYTIMRNIIKVKCKKHGFFKLKASDHLFNNSGKGGKCPKCKFNKPWSLKEFISKSRKKHGDRFSYIKSIDFTGATSPVTITCKKHGDFKINLAKLHIQNKGCCPECWKNTRRNNLKAGRTSIAENKWLDSLNISIRQKILYLYDENFKFVVVDGYDPDTNTIYEYYGSYWHGDPNVYSRDMYNKVAKMSMGELYDKTMNRERVLKEKGYKFITIWGNNYTKND